MRRRKIREVKEKKVKKPRKRNGEKSGRISVYLDKSTIDEFKTLCGDRTQDILRALIKKYLEKIKRIDEEEKARRNEYLKSGNKYRL